MPEGDEAARGRLSARVVDAILSIDKALETGKLHILARSLDGVPGLANDLRRALSDGTITEVRQSAASTSP